MARSRVATAWAVVDGGGLNVRSVSETRRAAIINWLITEAGQFISSSHEDGHVNALWDAQKGEAQVTAVSISYVQPS